MTCCFVYELVFILLLNTQQGNDRCQVLFTHFRKVSTYPLRGLGRLGRHMPSILPFSYYDSQWNLIVKSQICAGLVVKGVYESTRIIHWQWEDGVHSVRSNLYEMCPQLIDECTVLIRMIVAAWTSVHAWNRQQKTVTPWPRAIQC
jgi:hypothetical protein